MINIYDIYIYFPLLKIKRKWKMTEKNNLGLEIGRLKKFSVDIYSAIFTSGYWINFFSEKCYLQKERRKICSVSKQRKISFQRIWGAGSSILGCYPRNVHCFIKTSVGLQKQKSILLYRTKGVKIKIVHWKPLGNKFSEVLMILESGDWLITYIWCSS